MELALQRSFQFVFGDIGKLGKLKLTKSKNGCEDETIYLDLEDTA